MVFCITSLCTCVIIRCNMVYTCTFMFSDIVTCCILLRNGIRHQDSNVTMKKYVATCYLMMYICLSMLQHVRLCCAYVVRASYKMYIVVTVLLYEKVMDMCCVML